MKTLVLNILIITTNTFASVYCTKYFDRSTSTDVLKDLSRAKKISRLEIVTEKVRVLKANPKMIERDRLYIERLMKNDDLLYSGSIDLLHHKWKTLFRETEISFHRLAFHEKLLSEIPLNFNGSLLEALDQALPHFSKKFDRSLLATYQESYSSLKEFSNFLKKEIRKDAQKLGNKFNEYRLTRGHIEFAIRSSDCNLYCKGKAQELLDSLGVASKDEQLVFPSFASLKRPKMKDLKSVVFKQPIAYEFMKYQDIFFELKAVVRDLIIAPKARRTFVSLLYKKFPAKGDSIAVLDRILLNTEARVNHFPLIDMSIRKGSKDITSQLDILRSYNVSYTNDALLVTFARRVDSRARNNWNKLITYTQKNEPLLYERLITANKKAKLLGELSQNYNKSPARIILSLALGVGFYKGFEVIYEKVKKELVNLNKKSSVKLSEDDIAELESLTNLLSEGLVQFDISGV